MFPFRDSIYAARSDGTKLERVSDSEGKKFEVDYSPVISPDGTRVANATTRHKVSGINIKRNFDIETADLDGSN